MAFNLGPFNQMPFDRPYLPAVSSGALFASGIGSAQVATLNTVIASCAGSATGSASVSVETYIPAPVLGTVNQVLNQHCLSWTSAA